MGCGPHQIWQASRVSRRSRWTAPTLQGPLLPTVHKSPLRPPRRHRWIRALNWAPAHNGGQTTPITNVTRKEVTRGACRVVPACHRGSSPGRCVLRRHGGDAMSGLAGLLTGRREPGLYVWHSHLRPGDVAHAAEHARWRAFVVDGRSVCDKEALLDRLAASCGFPPAFERDWDALADCLSVLSWAEPARGFLLLYDGWGMLARSEPESWTAARQVMEGACAR